MAEVKSTATDAPAICAVCTGPEAAIPHPPSWHHGLLDTVYEFRPLPSDNARWLRYADGSWIEDDGEWDMAFVSPAGTYGAPFALYVSIPGYANIEWKWRTNQPLRWHYQLRDDATDFGANIDTFFRPTHPNAKVGREAMSKCSSIHHCANGRGPEFDLDNAYVKAGLVRVRGGAIVMPPESPVCFRCVNGMAGHLADEYGRHREDLLGDINATREEIRRLENRLMDERYALEHLEARGQADSYEKWLTDEVAHR